MATGSATACSAELAFQADDEERAEILDTESDLARAQHQANLDFAEQYQPTCISLDPSHRRPRVLVTGFGRFQSTTENATGRIVSELLETLEYPLTAAPPPGQVDLPGPQTRVAMENLHLEQSGEVEVCAMVLPVFWGLAAGLILEEINSFDPDFVLMNGVASSTQALSFELGAVNEVNGEADGSQILSPLEPGSPLVLDAPDEEFGRASLLSWQRVRSAAEVVIAAHAGTAQEGVAFGQVLPGADFAAFPRLDNTYLCNNVTYTVGYAMDHPEETLRLMESSHLQADNTPQFIPMQLRLDHSQTPRVFLHWPSSIQGEHLAPAGSVLASIIDAQLSALWQPGHEAPTRADNSLAD